MRKLALISAGLLAATLSACTTGGGTAAVTMRTVELIPASASVAVGQSTTLTATAKDAGVKPDEAQAVVLQPDERIPATRIVAAGMRNDSNQDFALTHLWP